MSDRDLESPDMVVDSMEWNADAGNLKCDGPNSAVKQVQSWRGVPLLEIYGSITPWAAPEFEPIVPAYNHAVLFHIPNNVASESCTRPPKPQRGKDKWDKDCVRMPCSSQSLYPVEEEDGTTNLCQRWTIIEKALSSTICDSNQLEKVILSYNTKFKKQWKFTALHKLFNEYLEEEETDYFFSVTLPSIANLALQLPQLVLTPIPLLRQHRNRSVSLSQHQIASLLANAFFCTFPRRNTLKPSSEYASYPDINFHRLYQCSNSESVMEKLKCILHYFRRVCTKEPTGVLTFTRRTVESGSCPDWTSSDIPIGATPLHVNSNGTIEDDGFGLLQIDFANKYLGGGVLGYGCVQEEIRFVICPELLISKLFTEMLKPTETLLIIGCERFSSYTGYADTFRWAGNYLDSTPRDSSGRRRCAVLAIDALHFSNSNAQYRPELIKRELNKAWVGFSVGTTTNLLNYPGIATGNWGCGAFGGSPKLKCLVQLLACSQARRPMAYYTFGDIEIRNDFINMYNYLAKNNITVGQLYTYLMNFEKSKIPRAQLYSYILQCHRDASVEWRSDNGSEMGSNLLTINQQFPFKHDTDSEVQKKSFNSKARVDNDMVLEAQESYNINTLLKDVNTDTSFIDLEQGKLTEGGNAKCTASTSKQSTNLSNVQTNDRELFWKKELHHEKRSSLTYFEIKSEKLNSSELRDHFMKRKFNMSAEESVPENDTGDRHWSTHSEKIPTNKIAKKITDYFNKRL